jgi:hypothetical protein
MGSMSPALALAIAVAVLVIVLAILWLRVFVPWGTRWGATEQEQADSMPGDDFLDEVEGLRSRVRMTRAISIEAPPHEVWRWLAQLGRGAGFYAIESLDNGAKASARHLVSWIPEPRLGDASAIGYLRVIVPGRELAWWLRDLTSLGTTMCMATCLRVRASGDGSRVVIRITGGGQGWTTTLVLHVFILIDTLMARRQLVTLKQCIEHAEAESSKAADSETGAHDQYQLYEVIYANGERAGVQGKEQAPQWRSLAQRELGDRMGSQPSAS